MKTIPITDSEVEGYQLSFAEDVADIHIVMPHTIDLQAAVNTAIRSGENFQLIVQVVGSAEQGWRGVRSFVDVSRLFSFTPVVMKLAQPKVKEPVTDNVIPFPARS